MCQWWHRSHLPVQAAASSLARVLRSGCFGHGSGGGGAALELVRDLGLPLHKCSQLGVGWDLQPVLLTCLGTAGHGASQSERLLADGRTGVGVE